MKKILLNILFLLIIISSYSQQDILYSQYNFNMTSINPSYVGINGYTTINLINRQQWIGMDDAPMTNTLSVDTRILKNSYISRSRRVKKRTKFKRPSGKVGVGAILYNDKNGLTSKTGLELIYAYHLDLDNSQLSFGVSLLNYQFRINNSDIFIYNDYDPIINKTRKNMFITDGSFGINYMYNYSFNIGISAKNLFESVIKYGDDKKFTDYKQIRQYYLYMNYIYNIDNYFDIEPSILLNVNKFFNIRTDITIKAYYQQNYWLGVSYRTSNSFITMVGIKIDKFYIGYAFDYSLNDIQRISYGSHEIALILKLGDNTRRYRWLNRF